MTIKFMNDEPIPVTPPTEPNGGTKPPSSVMWLFCAFVPSLVAIACFKIIASFKITVTGQQFLLAILVLNFFCSSKAGAKLARGVKSSEARLTLAILLTLFFFAANVVISIAVGCSGMGRIAP